MFKPVALLAVTAFAIAASAHAQAPGSPAPNDYGLRNYWLCRTDQTVTVAQANGNTTVKRWNAATKPSIDCFYVYPTVSLDRTPNSDMVPGPEERSVVDQQLNRFASQCRVLAPMYRQITIPSPRSGMTGHPMAGIDRELAYRDVRDAWNAYLAQDNRGRAWA